MQNSVETVINNDYARQLLRGEKPLEGINHDLHFIDHMPTHVEFAGMTVELLFVDLIEVQLSGIGWVPLSEEVRILDDQPRYTEGVETLPLPGHRRATPTQMLES